ncbi:heterokaryon incompatibility protein-domain-containing protein [Cadophora sp. MPI-SDFR-AT-0126]|nr:heterokaryon incompatibility protein-domain-containing protein [Leotiomycetes sp. MPI-SDFR-AT-0126]
MTLQLSPRVPSHSIPTTTFAFDYLPLLNQQIRLIQLLPGPKNSPIECKIVHSDLLSSLVPYECLSYMWGPPTPASTISMNYKSINIRQNLHHALNAIRFPSSIRTVWIDAICINQHDLLERNAQVAIMGSIFQRAEKVLVWLGRSQDDSDFLLDNIAPEPENEHQRQWGYVHYRWDGEVDERATKAMVEFATRPFWRRAWIIQEVLGARKLDFYVGERMIPMDYYRSASASFEFSELAKLADAGDPPEWVTKGIKDLHEAPATIILRQQYGGKTEDYSILRLLELCASCKSECQLLHDRIYGHLGVIKSSQQTLIVPDYAKPLSQVFVDVFLSIIIPDKAEDSHYITLWGYMGKCLHRSTRIVQNILENPLWDENAATYLPVEKISNEAQFEKMKELRLSVWLEGMAVVEEIGEALTMAELKADDLPDHDNATESQKQRLHEAIEELEERDFHCTSTIGTLYAKQITDPSSAYFTPIPSTATSFHPPRHTPSTNRTFSTHNGLLGIASSDIQKGDLIYGLNSLEWLFMGTNLFLILRPGTSNDPSHHSFTLIGRAIILPVPKEKYCKFRSQQGRGKFWEFDFKGDLLAAGIEIDHDEIWKDLVVDMDGVTLLLLAR